MHLTNNSTNHFIHSAISILKEIFDELGFCHFCFFRTFLSGDTGTATLKTSWSSGATLLRELYVILARTPCSDTIVSFLIPNCGSKQNVCVKIKKCLEPIIISIIIVINIISSGLTGLMLLTFCFPSLVLSCPVQVCRTNGEMPGRVGAFGSRQQHLPGSPQEQRVHRIRPQHKVSDELC